MKVAMLLLAAGRGNRMGAEVPKAYLPLAGQPLVVHSAARLLAAADDAERVDLLVLVHPDDRDRHLAAHVPMLERLAAPRGSLQIVDGGATRQQSMQRGIEATSADVDLVVVHDAARALVPTDRARAAIGAAAQHGAALLAVPATDTLKRVADGHVVETVDRSSIWYAQTPQIARRATFLAACQQAARDGFEATDDVSLLEHAGVEVFVVPGSTRNLKITHPDDLPVAAALLVADPSPLP